MQVCTYISMPNSLQTPVRLSVSLHSYKCVCVRVLQGDALACEICSCACTKMQWNAWFKIFFQFVENAQLPYVVFINIANPTLYILFILLLLIQTSQLSFWQ